MNSSNRPRNPTLPSVSTEATTEGNNLQDPELFKQADDDEQGGLYFEIDKSRISIRLTAPYIEDLLKAASELAKKGNPYQAVTL